MFLLLSVQWVRDVELQSVSEMLGLNDLKIFSNFNLKSPPRCAGSYVQSTSVIAGWTLSESKRVKNSGVFLVLAAPVGD